VIEGLSFALVAAPNQFVVVGLEALLREHPSMGMVSSVSDFNGLMDALQTGAGINLLFIDDDLLSGDKSSAIAEIVSENPAMSLIIMSDVADRGQVFSYLSAGANGFIVKSGSRSDLHTAVSVVLSGRIYVPAAFSSLQPKGRSRAEAPVDNVQSDTGLTFRQEQIMELVASGCSNKEIARKLGIAEATVKVHLATVFKRFGVHNRTGAVAQIQNLGSSGQRAA
jgi:two-component system, NarL family, nitrate/nitrite response regulator NarL